MPAGEYATESGLVQAAMRERAERTRRALSGVKDAEVAQAVLLGVLASDG
jgi:hypothetical protein